ncbi:MAG: hyaluronoglucosaminidase Hya [Bacteroidetes bacterium HLUCCA01]|nr:MAG: hyaluronoglucosaminidase Hya [Bacteroidetes bacterium HLUCCA01]
MDRSNFSRYVIAAVTGVFLLVVFAWRTWENAQRFEYTGVVEGFYGTPWSHEARLDMIDFMGEAGLKHYFYAPKDDPFHRTRWREPYTGEHLDRFKDYIRAAEEADVVLWFAISPGLSITYSSEEDYAALLAKVSDMLNLGVAHIALFLDDVPETLQHADDREQFASLGEAHAHLVRRLREDLRMRDVPLIVCPTTYTAAWGNRDYLRTLSEGIPDDIPLFWTGSDIAPAQITREDAELWADYIGRKPLLWDNFPVNDFETWRPIVGPVTGREPALSQTTLGIIANPMDTPYLSMIPLYTVGQYARRPFSYNPEDAWRDAIEHLAGNDAYQVLRPLLRLYMDYGWTDNVFTPLYTPGKPLNIQTIAESLDLFDQTLSELRDDRFKENRYVQQIIPELEPFARNTREQFRKLMDDPMYRVDPEGFLVYQRSREEILATGAAAVPDGEVREWEDGEFTELVPAAAGAEGRVRAAFRFRADTLYVAVDVKTGLPVVPASQSGWSGGEQILVIVDQTPRRESTWMEPADFTLLLRPPGSEQTHLTGGMYLTPFSQRGISDITMRTFSSFFAHFAGPVHPDNQAMLEGMRWQVQAGRDGYTAEIALPLAGQDETAVALSVNSRVRVNGEVQLVNFMLQQRPYIGNATTWVPVVLR